MAAGLSPPDPDTHRALGRYIRTSWHRPWAWGQVDCTLWVADWCLARSGRDPAALWRGRYETGAQMRAIIGGSLAGFLRTACPLPLTDNPRSGDAGVIRVTGLEVAAILIGGQWAFRHPRGIGLKRATPLITWRS